MSLAAFGSGLAQGFGDTYHQATEANRQREHQDRMVQANDIITLIKDPNTDPARHEDLLRQYFKLRGVKPKDAETVMGHYKAGASSLGLMPGEKPSGVSQTAPKQEAAGPAAPAEESALPQEAAPTQAPSAPAGPNPTSPLPQAPAAMQGQSQGKAQASAQPTPMDDLPTIASSTSAGVAPVDELPSSGFYDPNRGINKTTRQQGQTAKVEVAKKKELDLHDEEVFNRKIDAYKAEYGADPDPQAQKQMLEDVKDARAIKMGLPSRANYSGQAVTGADLKRVFGADTLPDGSLIDDNKSYNPVIRGSRIIDAHERAAPNAMRKVEDPKSPTGFSYANAQGQVQTGAPPPSNMVERQTIKEQVIHQNDGSILIRPTTTTTGPAKPVATSATPASPLPQRNGQPVGAGGTPKPAASAPNMLKAVRQGIVIPSPGARPLTSDQANKLSMNNQAGKSMVNTMADVNKNLDMMTELINAGKITIATDPGDDGAVHFVMSGEASRSLTPEQKKFAGDLQHLEEAINWIRGPMGAGGFRGKQAWNAIQASGVKRSADPDQVRQTLRRTMDFTLKQLAIQDKTLAKSNNQVKPELSTELANAYLQVYGTRTAAEAAAKSAGYSLE